MKIAPIPSNETNRLLELLSFEVLDTGPEAPFDDIVQMAALVCQTPIALVSLIDSERQWFKAKFGIDVCETPRDISFCGHAIESGDVFVISDADKDERFADNPAVKNFPFVKFYAGAPLITSQGYAVGTLCVIDHKPRYLTGEQIQILKKLSHQVVCQLEIKKFILNKNKNMDEIKDLSKKILEQEDKIRYVAKLEVLSEMAAGICHEINNPLAVVRLGVDQVVKNLKKMEGDFSGELRTLERVGFCADRIEKIVKSMHIFSQRQNSIREKLCMKDIVEESLMLANERLRSQDAAVIVSGDFTLHVEANRSQLLQVIHHLITNALEAISGKSDPWIRLDMFETDGVVSLRVADSGKGIPANIEKKIMQPFFTTKDVGKGTGLGLSVCRGIIGEHKGELVYEMYEGHTSFVIRLPATDKL